MGDDFPPDRIERPLLVPMAKYLAPSTLNSATAPAGFRMTIHAAHPYEAFKAAGWTDAQLLQYGYMAHDYAVARPTQLGDLPTTALDLAAVEKLLAEIPPEPIGEWMRGQGFPPEASLLILPEKMRVQLPAIAWPRYVRFSLHVAEPVLMLDVLGESYARRP